MSNETKRDVFKDLVEELANAYIALDGEGIGEDFTNEDKQAYLKDYEDALPDDLPVIPKAQSDWIKQCKANDDSLSFALGDETTPVEVAKTFRVLGGYTDKNKDKWLKLQNDFARAWVLGIWRVEETGEIVKLEEEK
ncbi:hypothetical protein [Lacticaseibacillus paracasei]|uniref:Phage protein n=1 Tax=Lacticaseibacillus paracasei (strain ATCC 334 / BCRC 17002 / CCUG 31169 / CIP 107868 / KCTC 3260 / NRRL B-441) TaxID=321967 RepID=Q037B8_LACP3|nr:hypothetical protein [Lacticaseibacillus paracasei]ABD83396.1 phage protein [Lacticaseibacillus paracasei ATCC 334]ABJ70704.1 hypothetical protein LSEI_1946 [Lacticaseibacillus paracasei ATCC 334]OSY81131.1 hypothetical protein BLW95_03610 [Lacticaseibacillus paracasei]